jgi:hypothetical protein
MPLKKKSTHLILIDHPKENLECLSYLSECSCVIYSGFPFVAGVEQEHSNRSLSCV